MTNLQSKHVVYVIPFSNKVVVLTYTIQYYIKKFCVRELKNQDLKGKVRRKWNIFRKKGDSNLVCEPNVTVKKKSGMFRGTEIIACTGKGQGPRTCENLRAREQARGDEVVLENWRKGMFFVRQIPFTKNNFTLNISLCCRTIQQVQTQKHVEQIGESQAYDSHYDIKQCTSAQLFYYKRQLYRLHVSTY